MDGFSFQRDIVPLVTLDFNGAKPSLVRYEGTAFLIAARVIVTCWHCVAVERPGHRFCALITAAENDVTYHPLSNVAKDANGADLATASVDLMPTIGLELGGDVLTGTNVYTYGYPLTRQERTPDGPVRMEVIGQYLRSYVTRICTHSHGQFAPMRSYELGMAAHKGLSGAPLLELQSKRVVGVIYGNNDYEQIEEFASIDPTTQARTPEVRRILSYGLACHTESLHNLTGPATRNLPLHAYCASTMRA